MKNICSWEPSAQDVGSNFAHMPASQPVQTNPATATATAPAQPQAQEVSAKKCKRKTAKRCLLLAHKFPLALSQKPALYAVNNKAHALRMRRTEPTAAAAASSID